jgi:hypothetical protein
MQRVLEIMKGREVHEAVAALPGYIAANTGAVSSTVKIISGEDGRKSKSMTSEASQSLLSPRRS